ncbi:MAG TPA: potassium transporter Kup [Bacteroidales bacterium]|jgi:KUP system potassium uptake protein|nr:potassium transporter Kup [Bacteroidales bacterium]HBZ21539.1 potassium transporter Kup [Bacteroidales bacterium]
MKESGNHPYIKKLSLFGVIVTMGIVFGDLGTSPLYTMRAILIGGGDNFSELLIYGSLSCIFWTLTLSTTIKYIIIVLRADNNGEGGIFALFAIIRKKSSWVAVLTMIGGAALLADGVLTPSITVTSAIEGLRMVNPEIPVVPIVLIIIAALFFIQQFGTKLIGSSFGPIMLIWFTMLGVLGISQVILHPFILRVVNPVYAFRFLSEYPGGFILLGAVFLCTTGAEALYADLGHCGRLNIRISWIYVKLCLLLNYFGQGAWLILNYTPGKDINPFFQIMPQWLLLPGIMLATAAAIIASQAIISGSFTLLSEAVSLNFWPRVRTLHPTYVMGQVYVPFVNWFLWIACTLVVISFQQSENMSAAYGLAITITEIMTTCLLSYYLLQKGINHRLILILIMVYLTIEGSFLIANLYKFKNGGWFTLLLASSYFLLMFGWYFGRKIKNRYITFANLNKYTDLFKDLSNDESVPKTATNLVYIIRANRKDQVESKIIFSIFQKQPKRADTYWFIHVNRVTDPNQLEYHVTQLIPGILIRVDFEIGFKVDPKINLYFREVIEDLVREGEIKLESGYDSLRKYNVPGDFKFVNIERIMPRDFKLSNRENFILTFYRIAGRLNNNDVKFLQLDSTNTIIEKVPILIDQPSHTRIKRMNTSE